MLFQASRKVHDSLRGTIWQKGIYLLFILTINAGASVTNDGHRWGSDDLIGHVRSVTVSESTLRQVGDEWKEEKPHHVWMSTFDTAHTFSETIYLVPVPDLSPRRNMCFSRDASNRIVAFYICDKDRQPVDSSRSVFRYDTHGRLIEEVNEQLNNTNSIGSRTEYKVRFQRKQNHHVDVRFRRYARDCYDIQSWRR